MFSIWYHCTVSALVKTKAFIVCNDEVKKKILKISYLCPVQAK